MQAIFDSQLLYKYAKRNLVVYSAKIPQSLITLIVMGRNGRAMLKATDGETDITSIFKAESKTNFQINVHTAKLVDALKGIPHQPVGFCIEGNMLKILIEGKTLSLDILN